MVVRDNPLVSILIPVYNREAIIEKCVSSALNQSYVNVEVVVVDNCSTDSTWNILTKMLSGNKNLRVQKNDMNIGPVLNWKKCINLARGSYLKILWSDDLMHELFIEETLSLFKNDQVGLVFTAVKFFNTSHLHLSETANYWKTTGLYPSNRYLQSILLNRGHNVPVSASCAIFKKDAITESFVEMIPNNFSLSHKETGAGTDALLFILTANKYPLIGYLNKPYSFFSYGFDSITKKEGTSLYQYYFTAYYYFMVRYYSEHMPKFKTVILYHLKFNSKLKPDSFTVLSKLFESISVDHSRTHLYYLVIKNIYLKLITSTIKISHLLSSGRLSETLIKRFVK